MVSNACNHRCYTINLLQNNVDWPIAFVGEDGSGWYSNSAHDVFGTYLLVLIDSKNECRPWGIRYRTTLLIQFGGPRHLT